MSFFPCRFPIALIASIGIATPVQAQQDEPSSRPVSVVVSAGASVPTGGFKDSHDVGVHGDLSVLLRLAGQGIRFRPEISYQRYSLRATPEDVPLSVAPLAVAGAREATLARVVPGTASGGSDVSTLLGFMGNLELPLARGFYLIGGVGASQIRTSATEDGEEARETALAYNGGAGLRFRVGAISAFIEGRLQNLSVEEGTALFTSVRTVPVTIGIAF
ncbi:MAG: hypothetical protein ACLGIK_04410 [Gemmatimonadota bacterium]